jgi:hypothetical protein
MAVRTAVLTEDAGIVAGTSSGVSGIEPSTGVERWTIEDSYLAGWYWSQEGLGPEAARKSSILGYIGVNRDTVTRLDPPPLAER